MLHDSTTIQLQLTTIQLQLTDRKNCPANNILRARLEVWSLWYNQFSIILLLDHEKFQPELEEISKAAFGNVSYLMNKTTAFDLVPQWMLLKVPFVWICISNYQRNSSLRGCIELFYRYKLWISGKWVKSSYLGGVCFPVLPPHVPLDNDPRL